MAWRAFAFVAVVGLCALYSQSGAEASGASNRSHAAQGQAPGAGGMQPGHYRTTITYSDVRGLPPQMAQHMMSRPRVTEDCMTTSDINAVVQDEIAAGGGMTCSQDQASAAGGVISGAASCRDEDGNSGTLTIGGTYSAAHADVSADLRAQTQMGPISEHIHLVSDRTGACS
jgi:hypothetical protein